MTIVDITLAPKSSDTACWRGGCIGNESAASGLRGHVVVTGQHYSCNARRRVRALLGNSAGRRCSHVLMNSSRSALIVAASVVGMP